MIKPKEKKKQGREGKFPPRKNGCFGNCHIKHSGIDSKMWKAYCKDKKAFERR